MTYEYEICPSDCPNEDYYNANRENLCFDCPRKTAKDAFKENAEDELTRRLGIYAEGFDVEKLLDLVYKVISFEDASCEYIDADVGSYLSVYLSEKRRFEKWKEEQKPK